MGIKILLADDSITIQKVIGIIFGGEDYTLTVVDNGKAAVDKAKETLPDVLLIDALMPGMTGYEVCEAVRATPELTTKPILLLTGSFEPFDEDKARSCGADDFLAKPFESQQIVSKVKELYDLGAARSAAPAASVVPASTAVQAEEPPTPVEPFVQPEPQVAVTAPAMPAAEPPPIKTDDIWGAFTPAEPPPASPVSASSVAAAMEPPSPFSEAQEPDVFAIINEENDIQVSTPSQAATGSHEHHTGSQWIPVEEQTFEFHEETVAELPPTVFTEPTPAATFGEISFEEETPAIPATPAATEVAAFSFEAPEAPSAEPTPAFAAPETTATAFETVGAPVFGESEPASTTSSAAPIAAAAAVAAAGIAAAGMTAPAATAAAAGPVQLSEEQLRAAIAGVSKEVIERIVWEVVPDLAETLIREAIRKIKEGV